MSIWPCALIPARSSLLRNSLPWSCTMRRFWETSPNSRRRWWGRPAWSLGWPLPVLTGRCWPGHTRRRGVVTGLCPSAGAYAG